MAKIIGLPKLSPTMDEGTLAKWVKHEGDAVEVDDLLAEVETDKATMEFRSFDRGVLLKILAEEGATLVPDAPVAIIGAKGEDVQALLAKVGAKSPSAVSPARDARAEEAPAASSGPGRAVPPPEAAPPAPARAGRVLASPAVRKIAREQGLDLGRVQGSGPRGRVVMGDLQAGAPSSAPPPPPGEARIVKVSQMRKTIARRLTESKQQVPHYYLAVELDAEPLLGARALLNTGLEATGEKVSLNDLIIRGAALTLREAPELNASFMGDTIHFHSRIDVSVAVAIPDGLITPVVRNADRKNVPEIAREVRELAARAREKRLKPEEFTNGTFSISNLGMFGVDEFAAVINPPEGAILAVGAVRDEAVVKGGKVLPGKRLTLTLSADHRVIDGATAAKWLATLRTYLEKPTKLV